ncbi:MAG: hypothetical protein AAF570_21485, partial [Bacteroidota bacterium]
GENVLKIKLSHDEQILSFQDVIDLWMSEPEFRTFYALQLAGAPFEAFFWEHPPLQAHTLDAPYECVLVNSQNLPRLRANARAFSEHFEGASDAVVHFANMSGDAHLIVPVPGNAATDLIRYPHIAAFVRNAPQAQIDLLFQTLAFQFDLRLAMGGTHWLNTAGMGVPWLHVRVDTRPKYYRFTPYKST